MSARSALKGAATFGRDSEATPRSILSELVGGGTDHQVMQLRERPDRNEQDEDEEEVEYETPENRPQAFSSLLALAPLRRNRPEAEMPRKRRDAHYGSGLAVSAAVEEFVRA